MRKIIIFTLSVLFSVASFAQKEHLKFMGIPLNGTITQFQAKLQAKGVRYNDKISAGLPEGSIAFDGVFAGETAKIFIYYNTKTKIVYRGKAVVFNKRLDLAEQIYGSFKDMLSAKYICTESNEDYNGYKASTYSAGKSMITLYITNENNKYYAIHIDYQDYLNSMSNISNKMDDL